ncbi:GGDEF domain-containing protein [Noviherbaspirillum sp. CPCC 100848]|uniref:diguanylate cyclase n=1 Tax=Noviherbaspirillum album TaxID=3080276 RepID=A0ABU6JAU0_9BURK|nr:GGDEF domain-containing protein [Noviherbaspirillum sp. CPCC 100848]MEC4720269.1 GGDEF domain-containing protein [Noviherbaspirillum sp. CPCC 100848]
MAELDPRSLIFVAGLLGLLCSAILFMLRRSFPPSIGGLNEWSWGLSGMVVASGLFGMTGAIPDLFCVVLANAMLVGGIMCFYAGFRHFAGLPSRSRLLKTVLLLVTAYVAWFTYVSPHYPSRALLVTFANTILFLACTVLVYRTTGASLAGRFTCMVFTGIGMVSAFRIGVLLLHFDATTSVFGATPMQKIYLAALAFSVLAITLGAIMLANERLRAELEFIASHDQLTKAYSRGAFIDILARELGRSLRSGRPLALLMCDLDSFKSINDRFGHAIGDRVIIDFAQRVQEVLRNIDCLGRYGGEEFVILLPDASPKDAESIARRICGHIAATAPDAALPHYTVSIGLAIAQEGTMQVDTLLSAADGALYRAKANGRNRVELAFPPPQQRRGERWAAA